MVFQAKEVNFALVNFFRHSELTRGESGRRNVWRSPFVTVKSKKKKYPEFDFFSKNWKQRVNFAALHNRILTDARKIRAINFLSQFSKDSGDFVSNTKYLL